MLKGDFYMEAGIIPIDKKIVTIAELKKMKISYYHVNKLVEQGILKKLNKFTYENTGYQGEEADYIYVYAYVPNGVICLLSAARYYGLTTYRPDAIDVSIQRKRKIRTLPDWPEIKLWYFDDIRQNTGIDEMEVCGEKISIFDIEKTVIDIIYYRNKIGIEETKEIITNYLKRTNRDINKLCRYANKLKCKTILDIYLEVLL